MDAVITYVDNTDNVWLEEFQRYQDGSESTFGTNSYRFCTWDNLKYCIRGIAKFMPFIRKVHLIVSGPTQVPSWINRNEVNIVYHKDIIPEECLPTFNSRTIEMCMHNIPDLDEEFVYFNDDMFVINMCTPEDFFINGKPNSNLNTYTKEGLMRKWGRGAIYSKPHLRCNEFPKRILEKNDEVYYLTNHGPSPMLKSDNIELFEILKDDILPTLSRFRTEDDFVHFMYSIYSFLKGNTSNKKMHNLYIPSNNFDIEKLYRVIYENTKTICVNDINYKKETEQYIKVFMATKKRVLEMKFPDVCKYENKPRVSLCTIIKNENRYLKEFVEHYLNLGFKNIYLYDNNDIDGETPKDVIGEYIESGFVVYIDFRGKTVCQKEAYNDCYKKYSNDCDWIAFFDCDEYLQLVKHNDISSFISQDIYSKYNSIFINWLCYGDSEKLYYEDKPLIERFYIPIMDNKTFFGSVPLNYYVKSILRTNIKKIYFEENVHFPSGDNVVACNTLGQPALKATYQPPVYAGALLRHYITKSLEEFINKVNRGYPDQIVSSRKKKEYLQRYFKVNKATPEKIELMNKLTKLNIE